MTTLIIGISGISGAGKTTVTQALSKVLNATAVFWDDFDEISTSPDDYVAWHNSGQGYETWDYPTLATTLDTLKKGNCVIHPVLNNELFPTKYIIFDAPLGRFHQQTGHFIDTWIHIDTPLDVALARRTLRDFKKDPRTVNHVLEDLQYYLDHSRPLFFDTAEKTAADFVVDGTLSIEKQIRSIRNFIGK
ncbi:MAG: uridine kinase [Alphaproteobacteria bacterium]|nr:uridine kinase [Alphaproteobacteria bacterium]